MNWVLLMCRLMVSLDDYTRVVLDSPGGDYINASYIKVSGIL